MKFQFIYLFFFFTCTIHAQDFNYLEEIKLENDADFKTHQNAIIKATNFLMSTNTNEQKMNRLACSKFIVRYATGVPDITLSMSNSILDLGKKNPEVLLMYMGLFMKSSMYDSEASKDFHQHYVFTEIAKYCRDGNGTKKTRVIRKLIRAHKGGKMQAWIDKM